MNLFSYVIVKLCRSYYNFKVIIRTLPSYLFAASNNMNDIPRKTKQNNYQLVRYLRKKRGNILIIGYSFGAKGNHSNENLLWHEIG